MEAIVSYFNSLELDWAYLLKAGGILLIGIIIFGSIGRFVFGKKSALSVAVSSTIAIIFMYILTVILRIAGVEFQQFLAPLPFVSFVDDSLILFSFSGADYTLICSEILSMIILAFLVNLLDRWLPRGKKLLTWFLFRCLTVILATLAHLIVYGLLTHYLPDGLVTYAPVVLLAVLAVMLLTGALKLAVGVALTTVNPLIAALYTFFFANVVGKQVTRAVLTTGIMSLLILALQYVGVAALAVTSAALVIYIPFLIIMLVFWYIVNKVL